MNFMLFLIKFIKFKQRIKFKKFELHNYGAQLVYSRRSLRTGVRDRIGEFQSSSRELWTRL